MEHLDLKPLVMGTGNPGVSQCLPWPVPLANPYPDYGYGFARVQVRVLMGFEGLRVGAEGQYINVYSTSYMKTKMI